MHIPLRLTPLTSHPASFSSGSGFEVRTTICCMSLHVRVGFASSARAHIPAARGADAEVPVCSTVHMWSGRNLPSISTDAILLSWPGVPELYVVASVDEHSSRYHGLYLHDNTNHWISDCPTCDAGTGTTVFRQSRQQTDIIRWAVRVPSSSAPQSIPPSTNCQAICCWLYITMQV